MKSFILTMLSLCAIWCCGAEVKLTEYKNGELQCVKVENQFYRIIITPQVGGKIGHWYDKVSNTAYVYTKLPDSPQKAQGHYGMLDDRSDFVSRPFECKTAYLPEEGKVIVALSAYSPKTKIKVNKTLTFFADTPVVNVKYNYENFSNGNITGFELGIRNFFYPSGDAVSTDDRYYFPTTHTLRRLYGYTHKDESGEAAVEMAAKLDACLGAPYSALLNIPKQCGLAISYEDDYYNGFHIWKSGIKYPTYEWTYHFLPAGHSHKTEFNLIQVNGLDSIAYAAKDLLSAVKITKEGKKIDIKTDLKFLSVPDGALRMEINCRAIGKKWNAKTVKFNLKGAVTAGKNATFNSSFTLPGNGLYEVEHLIYRKNVLVDSWREAVTCGKFNTLPVYKLKPRKITESAAIPGWKAAEPPKEEFDAADAKRGFAIFEPLQENAYNKCRAVELTIARNEIESYEFIVGNLGYLGNINVEAVNTGKLPVQVRVRRQIVRGGSGARPRIARILFADKKFELGDKQPVWITVGSRQNPVAAGEYSFTLKFTGRNNSKVEIPVKVKVIDLLFPARNMVNLESEGYPQLFPAAKDINVLEQWYKNMYDHGIDFFQFVGRSKKINAKALDHYIDNAIKYGLVIFKAARYDIRPAHPGEEEFWKALGEYLRQKGYQNKDMFVKILDEQPGEKYPAMAATGRWLKAAGFRPFSTFHNLFARPQNLKLLNGVFDMFQGGYTTAAEYQQRIKDGLLKPGDRFCHYTGTGSSPRSYTEMLFWGVQAAVLSHDLFHNHEYMRKGNRGLLSNSVYIDTDNCPRDAVSHEGLRDGMDIAQLSAMYRTWSKLLPAAKKAEMDKRFEAIVGGEKSSFPMIRIFDLGVIRESTTPVKLANYRKGRMALLMLVLDVKNLLGSKLNDAAVLTWNGKVIVSKKIAPAITAGNAEEKAAAALLLCKLGAKSGLANVDKINANGVNVTFRLAKTDGSYRILFDGKNSIVIQAATAENLKLGASNWVNTMDIAWEK